MENLKSYLNLKRFILISTLAAATLAFSSCNPVKLQEINLEKISQSSTGGDVYGGKQYVLPTPLNAPCADGRNFKSMLIQNAAGVFTLVRDKCDFLTDPQPVANSEVTSSNTGSVIFRGATYVERYAESNLPLFFDVGVTTKWCRGKLSSLSPVGSTALIEFAEQGDRQFKGQIAWLDYHDGRYDYYNANEIRLEYNSLYAAPIIGISGIDIRSGISASVRLGLGSDYTVTITKDSSSALLSLSCTGF